MATREKIIVDNELNIIIYGIVNTNFLKMIHPFVKTNLFKISYSKVVWGWVSEHYLKYNEAPGKYISDIWKNKIGMIKEDDEVSSIDLFLNNLSEKYETYNEVENIDPMFNDSRNYLKRRSLEVLKDSIGEALENNDLDKAEELQQSYTSVAKDNVIEYTGTELLNTEFKEPIPLVPEVLMLGSCVLLIGPAKTGKSWFALQLAIAISTGGMFLDKWKCNKRKKVLYLANEDAERTVKERLAKLKPENTDNLKIMFNWKARGQEAVNRVKNYVKENKQTRLVIIDCLGTVRGKSNNKSIYLDDYMEIERWRDLCHELTGVTILIIHHPKKTIGFNANDYDIMELISGSNGLGGAADRIMIMLRKRNDNVAKLYSYGRDSKDKSFGMYWEDVEHGPGWLIKGDGDIKKIEMKEDWKKIINVMEEYKEPMTQVQISNLVGCTQSNISQLMPDLIEEGFVKTIRFGNKNRYQYVP